MKNYAIAIHGGAGTIQKGSMSSEKETAYKLALQQAITAGESVLKSGGAALDAVEMAIVALENNPLFNAGKGAVFTNQGKNELDASIMDGFNLMAGAVAGLSGIKNPISLAKAVMLQSEHVMLAGQGALDFAKHVNAVFEPESYFYTDFRFEQLNEAKKTDSMQLDHNIKTEKKFGTVGAVAIDKNGNLAAGTSTGGMTNKKYGRIGDTPVIGAGTYANNETCAISCTGHGEFFLRAVVAYDISCLMAYKNFSLKEACNKVVMDKLVKLGGEGGLIAIDHLGNIELPFNSEGMYRASKKENGELYIGIYRD
ncbi:MAG: isoaspartyl peptidase/L-asparaginase [Bacteroidota bacterium]